MPLVLVAVALATAAYLQRLPRVLPAAALRVTDRAEPVVTPD